MARKRTLMPSPLAWADRPLPASYQYQTLLYDWLDRNGHGR
jgi:hypothetical protein